VPERAFADKLVGITITVAGRENSGDNRRIAG
jgi:hypothetical protein